MPIAFDGNSAAEKLKQKIAKRRNEIGRGIRLSILYPAEKTEQLTFSRFKQRFSGEVGIDTDITEVPEGANTQTYLSLIEQRQVISDGILLQLPVPAEVDKHTVLNAVPYSKDVEGLSAQRVGEMLQDDTDVFSPVAKAAIHATESAVAETGRVMERQKICVVGYNDLTGKPAAAYLARRCYVVHLCGSRTTNLADYTKDADIIISGTGTADLITADMVSNDAILIDIGFNPQDDKTVKGDFTKDAHKKSSFYTPVPGGIGPLTVAYIFDNLMTLVEENER